MDAKEADLRPDRERVGRVLGWIVVLVHFSGVRAFLVANHQHMIKSWDPESGRTAASWGELTFYLCPAVALLVATILPRLGWMARGDAKALLLLTFLLELLLAMAGISTV